MSIGGIGSVSPLLSQLQAQGLSKDKSKLVADDVAAATAQSGASGTAGAAKITPEVRAAIDTKISADVLSGKLTKSDATAVKAVLDKAEGQAAPTASGQSADAAPAAAEETGGAKAGGGGGGGESKKTELSESIVVAGSTKTTTITYTDNTTETTTKTATQSDIVRYSKPDAAQAEAAKEYSPAIEPGLIVDQLA